MHVPVLDLMHPGSAMPACSSFDGEHFFLNPFLSWCLLILYWSLILYYHFVHNQPLYMFSMLAQVPHRTLVRAQRDLF